MIKSCKLETRTTSLQDLIIGQKQSLSTIRQGSCKLKTVWRDFYTGQRLENWTMPYYSSSEDTTYDDTYNC